MTATPAPFVINRLSVKDDKFATVVVRSVRLSARLSADRPVILRYRCKPRAGGFRKPAIQRGNSGIFMRRSRVTEHATHVRLIRSNSDEKREFVSRPGAAAARTASLHTRVPATRD